MTDNPDPFKQLRKPFPPGTVGKLPKPYKKDSPRGECRQCGQYHGLPAMHLDYVGHAAVTDRLLEVDPQWTWEPMAFDQFGSPMTDHDGNLWIKLTVAGVTRIGVGDGPSMKERIGDALRNAAMRFGVALDLWSKEELESGQVAEEGHVKRAPDQQEPQQAPGGDSRPAVDPALDAARKELWRATEGHGTDKQRTAKMDQTLRALGTTRGEATAPQLRQAITLLDTQPAGAGN